MKDWRAEIIAKHSLSRIVTFLLVLVVLTMLYAGLWPQASYGDSWIKRQVDNSRIAIGFFGMLHGTVPDIVGAAIAKDKGYIAVSARFQLPGDDRFRVLAQLDSASGGEPLIIGQWRTLLVAMAGRDFRGKQGKPRIVLDVSPVLNRKVMLRLALDPIEPLLQVDHLSKRGVTPFAIHRAPDRVSIGNSPDGEHGWEGSLFEVILSAGSDVVPESGRFEYKPVDRDLPVVLESSQGNTLNAMKPGDFPDRQWIGSLPVSQLLHQNKKDLALNFLGFMPLGFLIVLYVLSGDLQKTPGNQVMLATYVGFLFSFFIESMQTMIPGRSPHTHDLILNSTGALVGALVCVLLVRYSYTGNFLIGQNQRRTENH